MQKNAIYCENNSKDLTRKKNWPLINTSSVRYRVNGVVYVRVGNRKRSVYVQFKHSLQRNFTEKSTFNSTRLNRFGRLNFGWLPSISRFICFQHSKENTFASHSRYNLRYKFFSYAILQSSIDIVAWRNKFHVIR